jgi:hypothetical protein
MKKITLMAALTFFAINARAMASNKENKKLSHETIKTISFEMGKISNFLVDIVYGTPGIVNEGTYCFTVSNTIKRDLNSSYMIEQSLEIIELTLRENDEQTNNFSSDISSKFSEIKDLITKQADTEKRWTSKCTPLSDVEGVYVMQNPTRAYYGFYRSRDRLVELASRLHVTVDGFIEWDL